VAAVDEADGIVRQASQAYMGQIDQLAGPAVNVRASFASPYPSAANPVTAANQVHAINQYVAAHGAAA
jgi:hypothetical protein